MSQLESVIQGLVRSEIQALNSYHVPDASGYIKLDAMENPNPWPGALQDQWHKALSDVEANRYPDPSAKELKLALRSLMALDDLAKETETDLDILLGNGSDEIIQILAMAVCTASRGILAPEPGFVMYQMIAKFLGVPYHGVALTEAFELDMEAMVQAIADHDPALIFLAVPNNPTGNVFALQDILKVIELSSGLVVIDEAYLAFTDSDLLELCASHDNVVVMRTLSKVGLAGLRLGFLVGQQAWLKEFDKLRLPYNINVLTQASACFALAHFDVLKQQTQLICDERVRLHNALIEFDALEPFESEANFILVRVLEGQARGVFEFMKRAGILVKCIDGAHPLLENCLRLTVGSASENDQMVAALSSFFKG